MATTTNPPVTKEQLQSARSGFLDAFAQCETALIALGKRLNLKAGDYTLGQRLDSLRKIKPSPTFSKAKADSLATLVERLTCLNEIRVDVVHSRMCVAPIAGQMRACLINAKHADNDAPIARLMTLEAFARCNKELNEIAGALAKI